MMDTLMGKCLHEEFVSFVIESAPIVISKSFEDAWSEVSRGIEGSEKRKVDSSLANSQPPKKVKVTKSVILVNNEKQELDDESGLEKAN